MVNSFKLGVDALSSFLEKILAPEEMKILLQMSKQEIKDFHYSDELWVKTVYNFATAFHNRIWPTDQLMKSMIPLYLGRTASFVIENWESSAEEVEIRIENLCQMFEQLKPLLIQLWDNHKV